LLHHLLFDGNVATGCRIPCVKHLDHNIAPSNDAFDVGELLLIVGERHLILWLYLLSLALFALLQGGEVVTFSLGSLDNFGLEREHVGKRVLLFSSFFGTCCSELPCRSSRTLMEGLDLPLDFVFLLESLSLRRASTWLVGELHSTTR